jgi:anti-sigma factor RsiW
MGNVIPLAGDRHQQVQSLLPWFVNGTLDEDEEAAVEAHLAECAECRADLATEMAMGREVAVASLDIDQGWAAMRARITKGDGVPAAPPLPDNVAPIRRKPLLKRPIAIGWAVAAQAVALALVVGGLELTRSEPTHVYHALGSAPAPAAGNVIVIFRPEATEFAMRTAFTRTGAKLVGGPTASDAYVLHVDAAKRAEALTALRADRNIVLAEPIDGPGIP